jgi:hypothetical protein
MKLRVRQNSLRLRLTQSEVAQFKESGIVEEALEFSPGAKLKYALLSADVEKVTASYADGQITISIPRAEAKNWTDTNQVSLESEQDIGTNHCLKILVEKDFACLERRAGEDDADTFPHPLQNVSRHC